MNAINKMLDTETESAANAIEQEFLTFYLASQLFGVPVLSIHDVLAPRDLATIPLSPPEVAGALNLRGRIITAIDMRTRLGLPADDKNRNGMSIVVEHDKEMYSLIVDRVGDVLRLDHGSYESNPVTLDARWGEVSLGVHRLEGELMIVLDVDRLLSFDG